MRLKRITLATALVSALLTAGTVALPAAQAAPAGSGGLADAAAAVDAAKVGGTAWGKDAKGRLKVTADATVSAAGLAKLRNATAKYGDSVTIERAAGVFKPLLSAGDAIYGGGYRCSLGFNVVKGGVYYFLTAGHCGGVVGTWYADGGQSTLVGPTVNASFPGNDYALVRYDNASVSHPGGFTVAEPFVGESVTRRGSTTGTHTGTVTALNTTVHYSSGETVRGLIQTNVCAESGDSGGALYDGTKALGLTSGGSGNCQVGGTTFYQPVREAVNKYKVTIY
ncbi:S1 family peptidase [Streptomyces polyrhachis]|uniref:S1 family peptidase n=1 Tax=Streptomyces polyrhachis TaxID=1282885 RepID=A0ABW2GIM0_9ACTN